MAESGKMNSEEGVQYDINIGNNGSARISIKKEEDLGIKPEPHECIVCTSQSNETNDIYSTKTNVSQIPLNVFLFKFTNVDIAGVQNCTTHMCRTCCDLINVLEQAELEYTRLKQTFEQIISKNPLFDPPAQETQLEAVKTEESYEDDYRDAYVELDRDSEDEPLAITKKKRHIQSDKRKKKQTITRKCKSSSIKDSWECNICGIKGIGTNAETAHKLVKHSLQGVGIVADVKKEDSADGSQSPSITNGFDEDGNSLFKIEMEEMFDDDNPAFVTKSISNGKDRKPSKVIVSNKGGHLKMRKKRDTKPLFRCDKCNAKYTTLTRLENHMIKHDDSKPPYICEICGAHYKHKRACDIHVALHKGISDWKCEECNKLFPSKGALQRHNNIHTGKPNYQCDLCGKSFIHTSSFKMHKLSHSGVKPHSCDECGLALMTSSHLKRHKRVHSGEKRHECTVCGKRFSERYNLAAHSKSHETADGEASAPQMVPRRRLFRCAFCQERFERRYMLERHMSLAHGRALERPPPTPRNTMSKLLKAQAQRREATRPASATTPKEEPLSNPDTPQKLYITTTSITPSAWSNVYAAEFGISRPEFPH